MYKTNLYGASEVKQNDNGDSVEINLPLTSDNGQFRLVMSKVFANQQKTLGYIYIENTLNNDIYWFSADYNRKNFNDSPDLGNDIRLKLQNNGDLVVYSGTDTQKASFNSSWTSKYGTHKPWTGGVDKKPYNLKLTDKGKLEIRDKNGAVIWSTTYMWESEVTPFSIPLVSTDEGGDFPIKYPSNFGLGNGTPDNSLIKTYYNQFYKGKDVPIDFKPFKIVSLGYLKDLGKAIDIQNISEGNGVLDIEKDPGSGDQGLFVFRTQLCFGPTDYFLPLGDYSYFAKYTNYPDERNLLVCLIKNEEKYCKKLTKGNYAFQSDSYKCDRATQFQLAVPQTIVQNQYVALGGIVGDNREDANLNRMNFDSQFVMAAVNNDFLIEYPKSYPGFKLVTKKDSRGRDYQEPDGSGSNKLWNIGRESSTCDSDHYFWFTTPFGTWMLTSNNFNYFSTIDSHNKFYDILPICVSLANCSGKFSLSVDGEKLSLDVPKCISIGIQNCSADSGNLPTQNCIDYFKYQNKITDQSSYNYNSEMTKFCIEKGKYQDPAYARLCACFLPTQVYQDYINTILEGLPQAQRDQVETALTQPAPCIYPACALESAETLPQYKFKRGESCTSNAYQFCISNKEIKLAADADIAGNVSADTMINCIQQQFRSDGTPIEGGVDISKKKSSNTLWIILGIIFVVLIILYFVFFKNRLAK